MIETENNGAIECSAWKVRASAAGTFLESESAARKNGTAVVLLEVIEADPRRRIVYLCDQFIGNF